MPTYDTPGVYIEELTGPGVIAGVGTSTAAFIGPALRGPLREARRISSYDEFLALYAAPLPDGTFQPYITSPHWFYLAFAVRAFYDNGGRQAYIVRVGTAAAALWEAHDQGGQPVFRVQARGVGVAGDGLTIEVKTAHATGSPGVKVAIGNSKVNAVSLSGLTVTVADATPFRPGDTVIKDGTVPRAVITKIAGNDLTLDNAIALAAGDTLRIADLVKAQKTIRLEKTLGLFPGSVIKVSEGADEDYALLESVDNAGFVTFASSPARTHDFKTDTTAPVLESQEFSLSVTPQGGATTLFDNLSLIPLHPGYVFSSVLSDQVEILPPLTPPTTSGYPQRLAKAEALAIAIHGADDNPHGVDSVEYQRGLDALRNVDEVNILCIPDAAAHSECFTIQKAMIQHCVDLKDRFAVLDSRPGAPPSGPGSVEDHRAQVESPSGRAALYYPWVEVRDPLDNHVPPRTIFIPPSGHMAGIYARTDQERGVHKAPANTDVRGILGLERRLTDGQQGPLNLEGINVLRIFQGSATVVVWGARTTVQKDVTDWTYVNVRRLMLFIEESIQEGIRWAVFEPNNLTLWQQLKRTINDFLTRVWRDGALFGDTADKAFRVRIDEALNPPSTRALGRLYIEISVAPVRPAEFIIVRIGQWDGGGEVKEG
jgi:uncharacterized protein